VRRGLAVPVAAAVAVAFADSSIVVLALPDLYGRFQTTIEGVSWVITAYNVAVASTALLFVFLVHRFRAAYVLGGGLVLFLAASIACAAANSLAFLIAARSVQGVGAALLLSGALPVIGARTWTLAGTYGLAVGPALGGVLTQAFDWRAIFVAQAPVAAVALLGVGRSQPEDVAIEGWRPSLRRTLPANTCLGLLFGALVGALFLAVLIVISVWSYSPIGGAAIVSALPIAALAARPLDRWLARSRPSARGQRSSRSGWWGSRCCPRRACGCWSGRCCSAAPASASRCRFSRTRRSRKGRTRRAAGH